MARLSTVTISACCLLTLSGYTFAGGLSPYEPPPELAALSELGPLSGNHTNIEFDGAYLSKVKVLQNRDGGLGNKAHVQQSGVRNKAKIVQDGSNNSAYIKQNGRFNIAKTIQSGEGHESAIMQNGYRNVAVHIQGGNAQHKGTINQSGNNNLAFIKTTTNNSRDISVNQTGRGRIIINNTF
ncbi:MAG: minor curlin subunit [Moritella dasanensis]|jgi:minor curlin subunit